MVLAGEVVLLGAVCAEGAGVPVGEAVTAQLVCDGCGSVIPYAHLRLEKEGFGLFGESDEPQHFCNWECLKEKAGEKCGGSAS